MYGKYLTAFWKDTGSDFAGVPQRLEEIELHSGNIVWDVPHGNLKNIWLATGLIAFIMIIAVMNFINLETVMAESSLKEIAIRKIAGSSRLDMVRLYMGETIFTAIISGMLALLFLVSFSWPLTAVFTGKQIHESLLFSPSIIASILILCLLIGFFAGVYPAIYLSRFTATKVMKDTSLKGMKTNSLIRVLVLTQFIIVVFLVSGMIIFYRQVDFMKDKDLGFNKEYVVAIDGLTPAVCKSYQSIKQELLRSEIIENVCLAQGINVENLSGQYASAAGSGLKPGLVRHTRTSHGLVNTFRLNLLSGRDFDSTMATDRKNFIINETAAKFLDFKGDPVGKHIVMSDTGMVIGVVKDFNFASLHNEIEPLLITLEQMRWGYLYVRLKSSHIQDGLSLISRTIRSVDPMYSLEYKFVDDIFNSMYSDEKKMSKFLFISTFLSILLAFMGLVALTSLTILRRVKEIGIRKINGARISEVLVLLNREYAGLIICAVLIGIPLSWIVMGNWLKGYAFRAGMPWWIYVLSGFVALSVSLITVTLISWRVATRNPVEALRYE
jgi:putative ABC transport system permease protein